MTKRAKFDAEKYINRNYVENEDAIISIYIEDVDDYYNEFDADELTLSDDVLNFIDSRVEAIPIKYSITLEFDSPIITLKEKDKLLNIIKSHYGLSSSMGQKVLQVNKYKALVFFLIGAIFLLLSHSMASYGKLVADILLIAGWVSIWETVSVLLFDNLKFMVNKRKIDRLYNAKVVFKERKE